MLPASGVNTAVFLISGLHGLPVSGASAASRLLKCVALPDGMTGSTMAPIPVTSA